jgi:hypothetical protein
MPHDAVSQHFFKGKLRTTSADEPIAIFAGPSMKCASNLPLPIDRTITAILEMEIDGVVDQYQGATA